MSGTISGIAVIQIEQDHGVSGARVKVIKRGGLKLWPEIQIAIFGVVIVFKVINDRALKQLSEEERRTKATMSHD